MHYSRLAAAGVVKVGDCSSATNATRLHPVGLECIRYSWRLAAIGMAFIVVPARSLAINPTSHLRHYLCS
jgi:hypothetical protein